MTRLFKTGIAGLALAGTLAVTAAPADAQRYRYRNYDRGDRGAALAIGAGIIGLGLAASLSSRDRYGYGGYYDRGYGYYGRNAYYDPYGRGGYYNRGYRRGYYRNCRSRVVWDPYYGDYVRVRSC